jgi:hypothetical protein
LIASSTLKGYTASLSIYTLFDCTPEGMKEDMDMYLLVANYSFNVGKEIGKVSKIYGSGIVAEPQDVAKQNSFIANRRLDIDYKRLEGSHIKFDKKYWE